MTAREAPSALLAAASASRIISFFRLRAAASITVPWLIALNVLLNFSGSIAWLDAMAGDLSAMRWSASGPGSAESSVEGDVIGRRGRVVLRAVALAPDTRAGPAQREAAVRAPRAERGGFA